MACFFSGFCTPQAIRVAGQMVPLRGANLMFTTAG